MQLNSITQNQWFNKTVGISFFVFWIFIFYQKINLPVKIKDRPMGEHTWAQIDRASMALTYYKDKAPFFLPRCHRATANTQGITAGEFPLIPYTVSKLYAVFGFNEMYHRIFVWVLSLTGFIFCYLLARQFLKSPLWAAFAAAVWMSSPNVIIYSISFLPETPALALVIIALYFLCRKPNGPSAWDGFFFSLFISLAGLIRVSSLLPAMAVVLAYVLTYSRNRLPGIRKKIYLALACSIPMILAVVWIYYSKWIVNHYHIFTFLMEPVPPTSMADLKQGLQLFLQHSNNFYVKGFYYFLAIASIPALIFVKRSNKFLLLSTCFIYLGFLLLFLVLFKKGIEHSYYWVPFQLGIFFHVAWLAHLASQIQLKPVIQFMVFAGIMVFMNYNAIHMDQNIQSRWSPVPNIYTPYYNLEPYLDSIQIPYGSRVVTYNDPTYNNTLYLMNRKGWSLSKDDAPDRVLRAFNSCSYAVLNDTSLLAKPELAGYLGKPMGVHQGLYIYQIQPPTTQIHTVEHF
jgi:hypothetical protein